jgi:hypothetical protein
MAVWENVTACVESLTITALLNGDDLYGLQLMANSPLPLSECYKVSRINQIDNYLMVPSLITGKAYTNSKLCQWMVPTF